ncbi:MAG: MerR family transcriptional regulator [Actinomycetota bacterium]
MEGFSAHEASRYTGCTPHQLRYWDRICLVTPGVQSTGGRPGVKRLYAFRDLVSLRVIKSLLDGGMSLQRIRKAIEFLRKKADLDEHLSALKLVTDGSSIFELTKSDGRIQDALREGQMSFFLAIDDVARSVDSKVSHYLYDREEFVGALRKVESQLAHELNMRERNARAAR